MMPIALDRLPAEILQSHRAVLWNHEQRDGKPTKVPYAPHDPESRAAVDDPQTWGTFAEAVTAYEEGKSDGVGIVLGDGLVGVDLDKCRDPETGEIDAEAQAIIRELDSYTEVSPSGRGVHIKLHGTLPPGRRRKGTIEMYCEGRYFTVTGRHLDGTPRTIEERTPQLTALHARLFSRNGPREPKASTITDDDAALLTKARSAHNGDKFSRLWAGDMRGHPSPSEADLALCTHLAFWTGADAARMDRLFRQSGLFREKWDERRGEQTYGEKTIAKALAHCHTTYQGAGPPPPGGSITVEHLTDVGNARRLVARHGASFRWCEAWGCFLVWDGRRWAKDDTGQVMRWAKETARAMYAEAADTADESLRKALGSHALKAEADAKLRAMVNVAKSEESIAIRPADLDTDRMLLTVENGTLDLQTGCLLAHHPEDFNTKLAPVTWDPEATAPTWEGFLHRILNGDADMIAFLQRAIGYSLTGLTREQVWFLLHGIGANGKSTLLRTVTDLLGDYAAWTPTRTLLAKRGEQIENDLARLHGARLVAAVEADGGRRLAEALVKQVTGGDPVTGRFLYGEYFSYIPVFKLWFGTNHKPQIRGTDHAVWRRIRLLPFTVVIPEPEWDRDLGEKLRAEFPGILRWAVDGCRQWQQQGIGLPEPVRQATAEYRETMDIIGAFVGECCVVDAKTCAGATDLYRAYVAWCEAAKEQADSQTRFGEALTERGFTVGRHRVTNRKIRVGLRLISEQSEQSEPVF